MSCGDFAKSGPQTPSGTRLASPSGEMRPNLPQRPPTPLQAFKSWVRTDNSFHARILLAAVAGVLVVVLLAGVFLILRWRESRTAAIRERTFASLRVAD